MVVQEDNFGCSVACVADLLSISYKQALQLFGKPDAAKNQGYYCRDIVEALNKADRVADCKYLNSHIIHRIYRPGTIVFVKRGSKYPAGHYLLRTKNGWMDPWINFPDTNKKSGLRLRLSGKPIYGVFLHI